MLKVVFGVILRKNVSGVFVRNKVLPNKFWCANSGGIKYQIILNLLVIYARCIGR